MSKLTANQHYVWQHYLRAWTAPHQLWCLRSDQKEPFPTSPRNVGSQRFFYEVQELTQDDLAYLEHIITKAKDPGLRDVNRGWVQSFQASFAIRRQLASRILDSSLREKLEIELSSIEKMMGERFHTETENRAIPILDALRHGELNFYENEELCMAFIHFLAFQYFRTAKMRNAMVAIEHTLPHDTNRTWPIESFIFGTNVGAGLFAHRRRYRIILLRNSSNIDLITGDQPVINLTSPEVEDISFYYPLTPRLAMIYTAESDRYPEGEREIGRLEVESYNFRIHTRSDDQIYGTDPEYLKALARLPKDTTLG